MEALKGTDAKMGDDAMLQLQRELWVLLSPRLCRRSRCESGEARVNKYST